MRINQSEQMDGRLLTARQGLQNAAFASLSADRTLHWVLEELLEVRVHARVLAESAVRLLPVSQSLLQPAGQHCDLIGSAFLDFCQGALLLCLQFVHPRLEVGGKLVHFSVMPSLLLAESPLQHSDVLLECLDFKTKDALLIARVISMALQLLSQFFLLCLELLVLAGQG